MPIDAMCLSSPSGSKSYSSQNILAMRNGLQMRWSNASLHPAQMINLRVIRNRTDEDLIRKTMGTNSPARCIEQSISSVIDPSNPQPAAVSSIDLRPESLFNHHHHRALTHFAQCIGNVASGLRSGQRPRGIASSVVCVEQTFVDP